MPAVVVHRTVTTEELAALSSPRDDVLLERPASDDPFSPAPRRSGGDDVLLERPLTDDPSDISRFELAEGPFKRWERSVEVVGPSGDGGAVVIERVDFSIAVPFWTLLFTPLMIRSIRRRRPGATGTPWWAPPGRLDARGSTVLGLLGLLSLFTGYLGTLLTQTNTFVGEEFDASDAELGWLLGVVRVGALLSLVLVALADRRGRRLILLAAVMAGCVATAAGALAPNMVWLGAAQTLARGCSMAAAILVAVVAVEEMPSRSRAYAISVLVMAAALGAGQAVLLLPVAGLGTGFWRILFAVPLLALWPILIIGHRLPETHRFLRSLSSPSSVVPTDPFAIPAEPGSPADAGLPAEEGSQVESVLAGEAALPGDTRPADDAGRKVSGHGARLVLLCVSAFCLELFVAPAAGFLNEYLRTERGFSAVQITLFTIITTTPAGLGIVIGGRVADVRGRRRVGAVGLVVGTVFTALTFLTTGWTIWVCSLLGTVVGAAAIPALGVYSSELFPTANRARSNGIVNMARVGGSFAGLVGAGLLADRLVGQLSSAVALLAIGPLVVVVLVLALYPETKGRELEELNPQDAPGRGNPGGA